MDSQIPQSQHSLIGRNPFDFINNNLSYGSALNCALYDVMGKYLEVPVYKLIGQKVRDAVPVAAWTRPAAPETFRDEISRAADQGYTIFKMHTCDYHDVMEQTRRRRRGRAGGALRFIMTSIATGVWQQSSPSFRN